MWTSRECSLRLFGLVKTIQRLLLARCVLSLDMSVDRGALAIMESLRGDKDAVLGSRGLCEPFAPSLR